MKHVATVIFLSIFCISTKANAQKLEWRGTETLTTIGGEFTLIDKKLKLRGNTVLYFVPKTGVYSVFAYVGPKWIITDWVWIAPQIGTALHWGDGNNDTFIASLMVGFSFFKQAFTIFLEAEAYLNKNVADYYGYYSFDFNFSKYAGVGIQAEQVNANLLFGPHVTVRYKFWGLQLEYYLAILPRVYYGHTLRIVTALYFE